MKTSDWFSGAGAYDYSASIEEIEKYLTAGPKRR